MIVDVEPGDVYADDNGKLWRVVGVFHEPSVSMEEIEHTVPDNPLRVTGGMSGLMWHRFRRIFRPEKRKELVG